MEKRFLKTNKIGTLPEKIISDRLWPDYIHTLHHAHIFALKYGAGLNSLVVVLFTG